MVAPVAFAPRRRQQAPEDVVGTGKKSSATTSTVLWVLGLCAASAAITVAVCVPPPALHKNAYFLAISCFFFAGVAGVMSAVCMAATTHLRDRDTTSTGRKLMYVLLARVASVVGAAFSTTTSLGMLDIAAASTAITLAACVPPPALHKNAYFLAISCFFFAGVAGVMSAVCMAATTHLRDRDTTSTGRKLMYVLLARVASVVGAAFSTTTSCFFVSRTSARAPVDAGGVAGTEARPMKPKEAASSTRPKSSRPKKVNERYAGEAWSK